ncbi:MAG: beta-hydroxyacyl-ACP dehydratase [Phycisphaerae bacterium]|nr:beta-hydroxyacyl-ACP dehydratase [Phycisphaerae bacterium]
MPPTFLFDLSTIDLNKVEFDKAAILEVNPQRGDMEQLDGIIWADKDQKSILGFKDVRADEFWVEGHIPGRPLLPGVLMIECAAQVASFYCRVFLNWTGFVGFGGVEDVKFRQQVVPGQRLLMLAQHVWERHRRIKCNVQGVIDGTIVFEASIIGAQL